MLIIADAWVPKKQKKALVRSGRSETEPLYKELGCCRCAESSGLNQVGTSEGTWVEKKADGIQHPLATTRKEARTAAGVDCVSEV